MRWKQFLTPVRSMDVEKARAYMNHHKEGSYTLLDVRQPREYEKGRIPGAKLIPLPELSDRLGEIDPDKPTIAYWAAGGRSRVAAQFLAGQGFKEVYNLKGGMNAWNGLKAVGPAEVGMAFITGDENPEEIIILAYGMEEGLRSFYSTMALQTTDQEVGVFFSKLSSIEVKHKEKLFELYKTYREDVPDTETFEQRIIPKVMEGGVTAEEFLEVNKPALQSVPDVINVSMSIEAQALDLYLRYSVKSEDEKTKKVLYGIAEEEKGHLRQLGSLLSKYV